MIGRPGRSSANTGGVWNVTGSSAACGTPCPFSVNDVQQDRPLLAFRFAEYLRSARQVVAVDRAEVAEAQFLEQHPALKNAFRPSLICSSSRSAMSPTSGMLSTGAA